MGGPQHATEGGLRAVHVFLVADIRGYTAYTARFGDLAASRLAMRFATIMGEGARAWSGRLVELRGDEALVVFDEPQAALEAAAELQDAFAHETTAEPGQALPVGMGLDLGEAVSVGDGYRGQALNLAARLCGVSRAGEVHASVPVVERAGSPAGLEFEPVVGLELKGFGPDQRAFRVRSSAHACPDPLRPPAGPPEGELLSGELDTEHPLAGREAEMRWLGWHWRRARHGHGRAVLVHGPSGVGKTRLVSELAALALQDGAWVSCRSVAGPGPPGPVAPGPADRRPGVVIIDGGASGPPGVACLESLHRKAILEVIVSRGSGGTSGSPAVPVPPSSRLEVAPLDMAGLRELAAVEAPDDVDELPFGRILDESKGLPAPARTAIREWASRVEAERAAVAPGALTAAEASSFIGRAHELSVAEGLLSETRLLTLVGPPGTGKTRLALRLLREYGSRYGGGSWFVPLHAIRDPELVGSAIARALGLRESAEAPALEVAKAYLAEREALLVLDNFEQLLEAASAVGELLAVAPDLTMVVTSRSSLGVPGEQLYAVPPMELPPIGQGVGAEGLRTYDATALFLARARAVDPDFTFDATNAEAVGRVTTRLEGLPLAIELAAARVRTLAPIELLEHLDRRLPVLTSGDPGHEDRHRTMRGAIAWSYELLTEGEQALVRRLAVFRGGFTLDLAAQLTMLPELETIDGVDALVSRSLLTRAPAATKTRFSMLELVREFAVDELASRGELTDATDRHAQAFLALALETGPALEGDGETEALARLTPEVDNIRAALEHALAAQDAALGLRLGAPLWRLWQSIGQLAEGRHWLERCLRLEGGSVADRADAHGAIAGLAYWQGDFQASREHYTQARDLFRSVGDRVEEANATYCLSLVATLEGQLDLAERHVHDALAVFRELGLEGKVAEALTAQFTVAWRQGELTLARAYAEEAATTSLRLGNRALAASQLLGVAGVAFQQGELSIAVTTASESLDIAIETSNTHTQLFALDSIASFTVSEMPVAAVRLCAAASVLREQHGGGWTLESFGIGSAKFAAAGSLSAEGIEEAWQAGTSLDLEGAIEVARSIIEGWPPPGRT